MLSSRSHWRSLGVEDFAELVSLDGDQEGKSWGYYGAQERPAGDESPAGPGKELLRT